MLTLVPAYAIVGLVLRQLSAGSGEGQSRSRDADVKVKRVANQSGALPVCP